MVSTGIVRATDQLGRIVIPKEIRRNFKIEEGDTLEIFTQGDNIILKKYTPGCHCCKNMDNLTEVLGLKLCEECMNKFNEARKLINGIR